MFTIFWGPANYFSELILLLIIPRFLAKMWPWSSSTKRVLSQLHSNIVGWARNWSTSSSGRELKNWTFWSDWGQVLITVDVKKSHLLDIKLKLALILLNIARRLIPSIALLLRIAWQIFFRGFLLILGGYS